MADCRYCGKRAGFMRWQHAECRGRHDEAAAKIEEFFVKALQSQIDSNQFHELINQDAAQNSISQAERDELIRSGMGAMIQSALASGPLNNSDDKRIAAFQKSFNFLSMDELGSDGFALAKARILKALDTGSRTPQLLIDGPYAPKLEADEHALWIFSSVRYFTYRTRTRYVGSSIGFSTRIARGLWFHASDHHGEPIRNEYINMEDSGCLTLTMSNVYFVPDTR